MTLIKSMLLGSAAGIVAVAGAQAADLPTHKAAPVEYVRVCNVAGITGWVLPGSDTCMKISGYVSAQFVGGNLNTQYNWGSFNQFNTAVLNTNFLYGTGYATTFPVDGTRITPHVLIAASDPQQNTSFFRDQFGWSTRGEIDLDFASNTFYGPLLGHISVRGDLGNGLDNLIGQGVDAFYVDQAYLSWAGITAGKAQSFFSFIGGGDNWANLFSPDRKGFNEPLLMAYTASFGGGFSATLSFESPGPVGYSGSGSMMGPFPKGFNNLGGNQGPIGGFNPLDNDFGGQRWPDIVGALHV